MGWHYEKDSPSGLLSDSDSVSGRLPAGAHRGRKRTPLEYEVVEPEQLPEEAAALVEEKRLQSSGSHIRAEKSFI